MHQEEEIFNKMGIVITFADMKTRVNTMRVRITKRSCIAALQKRSKLVERTADHAEMQKIEVKMTKIVISLRFWVRKNVLIL